MTMAMSGEEPAPITPEERPDLLTIGLRQFQARKPVGWKEFETPFAMRLRQRQQFPVDLEKKHQPMRLPFVSVLADQPGQVEV